MRIAIFTLAALLTTGSLPAAENELPNIGTPADSVMSQDEEYQIGRMVVKGLRDQGQIVEDPEITAYLQTIGSKIASHAQEDGQRFQFFAVKDPRINAFALPGGFIGVNIGLVLATQNESELAGVLAHEIAHVTQRHIARSVRAQSRSGMVSAAAMLAAILIAATTGGGGDAMMGVIAASQGVAAQQQLNFTRSNEQEADRIGIGNLAAAGFNPNGVPDFWETVNRRYGSTPGQALEFIQSHPLTTNRMAEARDRAREFASNRSSPDSLSYRLSRERLRILSIPAESNPRAYYERYLTSIDKPDESHRYGRALSLIAANAPEEAVPILNGLVEKHDTVIQYRTALGEAQMKADQSQESLVTFERAMQLFPRDVRLTMAYADALLRAGQAKRAHQILLDLFNAIAPTPEQARFIAVVANSAGDVADAYSYMAEYHIMSGDLLLAIDQLQLALAVPNLTDVQKARFQARMDQIREYLPKNAERMAERRRREEEEKERERRRP